MQTELLGDDDRYQIQDPIDRGSVSIAYRGWDRVVR